MDLTKEFPRSPKEKLDGLAWLPRLIDKAKARLAGTLGEYNYNCPMDVRFFVFLGLTPEAFLDAVREDASDAAVAAWVAEHGQKRADAEKADFNRMLASLGPDKPDPGKPSTWFGLIDAEEGRG